MVEKKETKTGFKKTSKKRSKVRTSKKTLTSNIQAPASKSEPQTMEELLARTGYELKAAKKGQMVEGTIALNSPPEILIDIGAKTEATLASKERDEVALFLKQLKVGDRVQAFVISAENELGQPVVSFRQAAADYKWEKVLSLLSSGQAVEVRGIEANKGGLVVDFGGLRGFVPSSQLGSEHIGKGKNLVNVILTVKVIEVDRSKNRLVFSEKKVLSPEEEKKRKKIWEKTKIGDKVKGEVTAVLPFGVFLNIGGVEGLVHISEIAWEKVDNPASYFKMKDSVKTLVIGREDQIGQLQLSVKQLTPDPWEKVAKKYKENQSVAGRVIKKEPYGAFIRLEEGLDALLHISKIPPDTVVKVGDKLKCIVESVDTEKRRISLTLLPKEKPVGYK